MIPHIIHYCWFGKNAMPDKIEKYVSSWKKVLPDWQFICWSEDNFDVDHNIPYVKEAYYRGKYAFVSDYVRLCALRDYGGIYLDTDIEIVRSFENIINNSSIELVAAFESEKLLMTAFIASSKNSQIINEFIKVYTDIQFMKKNNEYDVTPNTVRFTEILIRHGLELENKNQELEEGRILVYTDDYFSGYNMENSHPKITENTYTIHHFESSWKKLGFKTWVKYKVIVKAVQSVIGYDNYDKLKDRLHL